MPLPPKGDPRRPLHLAIRSTRLLGGLFVVLGLFSLLPMLMSLRGGSLRGMAIYFAAGGMTYFVPGTLYILCSIYLRRRQLWAVIVALAVASIQLLFVLLALLRITVGGLTQSIGALPVFMFIFLALVALIGFALAQLVYHLIKSFGAIKHPPFGDEGRGFEPIPLAQAVAAPPAPGGPDAAPPAW